MHTRQSLFNVPFGRMRRSRANACLCIAAMVSIAAVLSLTASGAHGAGRGIPYGFCGGPLFRQIPCGSPQDHLYDYAVAYGNPGVNFSKCVYMHDYPPNGRGTPRHCMGGTEIPVSGPKVYPNYYYDYHAFVINDDCCNVFVVYGAAKY